MNKVKTLVSIAAALALLLSLAVPVAFADEDTTTGQFQPANVAPTITSVEIIPAGGGSALTSMDPSVSYKAKIVAGDSNTIDDIDQVRVAIVYDASDADPTVDPGETGNVQTLACLKWVKSGSVWSIDPTGGSPASTWTITDVSCVPPSDMTLTTGTWEFYFTVGKVATEATGGGGNPGWDLFGEVVDGDGAVEEWGDRDLAITWYGEVTSNTPTADFGTVTLGAADYANDVNEVNTIEMNSSPMATTMSR